MGQDDDNVGDGAMECPGHEYAFAQAVPTEPTQHGLVGLNLVEECRWCGAVRYEPSNFEQL